MHELIHWHNSYSVFVKSIDDQHKMLIDLLNELYDAYLHNKYHEKIGQIIAQLLEYAAEHFSTEETYFEKYNYDGAREHIAEHKMFIAKIKEFERDYHKHDTTTTLMAINFLNDWLKHHILETDRQYIPCFLKHKVQ